MAGSATYSPVRAVALTLADSGLRLFPNPAYQVATSWAAGQLVLSTRAGADGQATLTQPPGVYPVRAGPQTTRLTME